MQNMTGSRLELRKEHPLRNLRSVKGFFPLASGTALSLKELSMDLIRTETAQSEPEMRQSLPDSV